MLHLMPQWQSSTRHERLKEVMADRPDLIQSELAVGPPFCLVSSLWPALMALQGMAFDALQQCFRGQDIEAFMAMQPPPLEWKQTVFLIVDPAAGGPRSDFAIISMVRYKGLATVGHDAKYATLILRSTSASCMRSSMKKGGRRSCLRLRRKRVAL